MIRNLVLLGEQDDIASHLRKLRPVAEALQISRIIRALDSGEYKTALEEIDVYMRKTTALVAAGFADIALLRLQLESLELRLESLTNDKAELERRLITFNRRYDEMLGDLTQRILKARAEHARLLAAKEKSRQERENAEATAHDAEEAYKDYSRWHEELQQAEPLPKLNDEAERELKSLYRKACSLCHPDKVTEEKKEAAHRVFVELQDAYKGNDLTRLRKIYDTLKLGGLPVTRSNTLSETEALKAAIAELEYSIAKLVFELKALHESDGITLMDAAGITEAEWQSFLERQRQTLETELTTVVSDILRRRPKYRVPMSKEETERSAIIPYAPNYLAQVQAAGRQLGIAAQLNQDIARRRFITILKRIPSKEAIFFLSTWQALDGDLINRFAERWDWGFGLHKGGISCNEALLWSPELIERFENRWSWDGFSCNEALPWSLDLIKRFEDRWEWSGLSYNEGLPWSLNLIERFETRWDWGGLSCNKALPWSPEFIERFEDRWVWRWLSWNEAPPWSLDLIERFENHWEWPWLCLNEALPWSLDLIERFKNRWDLEWLTENKALPWSLDLIERFKAPSRWSGLSKNRGLPWSRDLIERFKNRWDWENLSTNEGLPWSLDLLERFKNRWNWENLSINGGLPWSLDLIERFEDRWDWRRLSNNKGLPWSLDLIERFEDRWNLKHLCWNKALPWSLDLIERFPHVWYFGWCPDDDHDHWFNKMKWISWNQAPFLSSLRRSEVLEIMALHLGDGTKSLS
jgi:hypothetical protein